MQSLIYFFIISMTVSFCLLISLRRAHQFKFPLDLYFSLTGWLLLAIPLGARLLHVLYEEPQYYLENPLRIFEVWKGGFVYYGGTLLGLFFCLFYFLKPRKRDFLESADFFAPVLSLGTGLGRLACFFQGCCFGAPLDFVWSVRGRHPTQLYILLWEMILFALLFKMEKLRPPKGSLFFGWIGLSAAGRFVIEFYRADFRGQQLAGLSVSQLISIVIVTCGLIFLIVQLTSRKPSPQT